MAIVIGPRAGLSGGTVGQRAVGAAILVVGVVLIGMGLEAKGSFASRAKEFWDGTPTRKVMHLLGGGALCCIVGLGLALHGGGRKS
jgi:hypothetical protein